MSTAKTANDSSYVAIANNESDIELLSCEPPGKTTNNDQALSSSEVAPKILSLLDDWDELSGLAFVFVPEATVLQTSGLLSGPFAIRIGSHLDEDPELYVPYRSALHVQASRLQNDFDRHHDLGGLSITKTWGLASWGPYVASCITMHPGDMIEYTLVSEHRCHILFSQEDIGHDLEDDAIFPWQVSSKQIHQQTGSAVLEKILSALGELPPSQMVAGRKTLYNICCAAIICPDVRNWALVDRLLLQLSVSDGISYDSELDVLQGFNASRMSMLERAEELNRIVSANLEQQDPAIRDPRFEFCSICERLIVWQDLNQACCLSGHQFARCSLTSIPITVPGISKSCETCHREFINEAQLTNRLSNDGSVGEKDSQQDRRPPADDAELVRLSSDLELIKELFDQFDICPYCQGKYIG
ncbi:MAG: hypothetical protein Q9168_003804 [Polycauliona sp. 1 TL-2023]